MALGSKEDTNGRACSETRRPREQGGPDLTATCKCHNCPPNLHLHVAALRMSPEGWLQGQEVVCLRRVQATQRAGRAGRTRDGKCYRLYTQKCFERDMPAETLPEIQRTSMLTAVLFLKSLPLDIDVLAFDYLDHPGVSLPSLARVLTCMVPPIIC